MRKQDKDLARMTPGALRREVMRVRTAIRRHRNAKGNARCWHNDLALYGALPECAPVGRMEGDPATLLKNCRRYIRRQQCGISCPQRQ